MQTLEDINSVGVKENECLTVPAVDLSLACVQSGIYPKIVQADQSKQCRPWSDVAELTRVYTVCHSAVLDIPSSSKYWHSFRKHAYSNILKILPPKNENFQIKKSDMFFIFLLKT